MCGFVYLILYNKYKIECIKEIVFIYIVIDKCIYLLCFFFEGMNFWDVNVCIMFYIWIVMNYVLIKFVGGKWGINIVGN